MGDPRAGDDTISGAPTHRVVQINDYAGMIDYYGFAQGFAVLFIVAPLVIGAGAGAVWARRTGRRGGHVVLYAAVCGVTLTVIVFVVAVLFFRA